MENCKLCKFYRATTGWKLSEYDCKNILERQKAGIEVKTFGKCFRNPNTVDVHETHWCGEFKENVID